MSLVSLTMRHFMIFFFLERLFLERLNDVVFYHSLSCFFYERPSSTLILHQTFEIDVEVVVNSQPSLNMFDVLCV